jgi:hypothetical protein
MLTLIGELCRFGFMNTAGFVAGVRRQRVAVPIGNK